jgi:hypothetical protein
LDPIADAELGEDALEWVLTVDSSITRVAPARKP